MRKMLRNDPWERIERFLPGKAADPGAAARDNRLFLKAVPWIARTGSPWRDLPPPLGNRHNTYTRFSRWGKKGVWQSLIKAVSDDRDLGALFIDSAIVRAHPHAAGAPKNTGRRRSRGGLSTKIHATADAPAFDRRRGGRYHAGPRPDRGPEHRGGHG